MNGNGNTVASLKKMKKDSLIKEVQFLREEKADSWMNIITGLGMSAYDKRVHTTIGLSTILDRQQLLDIFRSEGLGKKIITMPANDMVREWFTIEGDPSNSIIQVMNDISAKSNFKEALIWARLFGGSVILMGINDGQDFEMPVNPDNIVSIDYLEVYERWSIQWVATDLYNDPKKPNYGMPEWYTLINQSTAARFRVHASRILRFDGELLPLVERRTNQSWGDSVMQSVFTRLRGLCDGLAGSEHLLTDFIIGVLKVPNLQQMLSQPGGDGKIRNRMKALDMVKHIMNTLVMDKNEEYERHSATATAGLEKLLSLAVDILCSVSGLPRVKLIGEQTKGLGSQASGNVRLYYDDIAAKQEDEILRQCERLTKYIMLSKKGPTEGKELESWSVIFKPLWQPTEEEDEKTRELVAKRDEIYAGMGLPVEIILMSRFGGDSYSRELVLPEAYKDQLQEIIDAADWFADNEENNGGENIPNAEDDEQNRDPDKGNEVNE